MTEFQDKDLVGKGVLPADSRGVRVLPRPDKSVGAMVIAKNRRQEFGIFTGRIIKNGSFKYYQVTLYKPQIFNKTTGKYEDTKANTPGSTRVAYVYERFSVLNDPLSKFGKDELDGEQVVRATVHNLNVLGKDLNEVNVLLHANAAKGIDVKKYEAAHKVISADHARMVKRLKNNGVDLSEEQEPSYWEKTKTYFKMFGLGLAPLVVIGIIALVSLIAGGTIAYFAFWPDYENSNYRIQETREIKDILTKLSPDEAQKVRDFMNDEAKKGYETGKTEGQYGSYWSLAKNAALIGGGIWLFTKITDKK